MTDAASEGGREGVFPAHGDRVYGALDKERFDLCMTMLKGYYDGLEARVAGTITALVVAIGWLIGSDAARNALRTDAWLCGVAIVTLTAALLMYGANDVFFLVCLGLTVLPS